MGVQKMRLPHKPESEENKMTEKRKKLSLILQNLEMEELKFILEKLKEYRKEHQK